VSDTLIRLETYTSELEAEMARARLQALGVEVMVRTDNCGGMRPHLDLQQGVRLFVAAENVEKARAILSTIADPGTVPSPWTCPTCQESIEAGFDACWQCGFQQS
jgi:hypothetical protein